MKSLIVIDGYNFIFKYYSRKSVSSDKLEQLRHKLINDLAEYKHAGDCDIVIVFDSQKSSEKERHSIKTKGVEVIFSGKAKTADSIIEEIAHLKEGYDKKFIVTSDNIQQTVIFKENIYRKSVREFCMELNQQKRETRHKLSQINKSQNSSFSSFERKLDRKSKEELSRLKDKLITKKHIKN
ncbi:MAG: NYN domain-containing protein [Actinobacteria bacterium]|nr:NYN domain-containing protein [Actinomycetota bacterium]MCL6087971.1 NYN domain-containing protein [Actinomycetota bacterium]